jgi:hypothetical protein
MGVITTGVYKGKFIITKSGRFGDKESLLKIVDYLGIGKL